MSSSIAELIAAYSPPIPAPVKNRIARNHHGVHEAAVSTVATRYSAERDQEEVLAAEAIGELPEEQGAEAGAGDVDRLRAVPRRSR